MSMRIGDLLWKREFCFHRDLCKIYLMQFEMDEQLRIS